MCHQYNMKKTKLYSEISKLDKEHILYLVILRNNTEAFCKIGITSQTVEERMSWIDNYQYTLVSSIKGDGFTIRGFESVLKEQILDYSKHYQPKQRIAGYTECYDIGYCDSIEKAFKYIKKKKPKEKDSNNELKERVKLLEKTNENLFRELQINKMELEYQELVHEAKIKLLQFQLRLLENDDDEITIGKI